MERIRVDLHWWVSEDQAGGGVRPYGDPLNQWTVTKIHARYVAPATQYGDTDQDGRPLKRRFRMRAYLIDLDGGRTLDDYDRVLLHQVPPVGWWYIKQADEAHLERMERFRVE